MEINIVYLVASLIIGGIFFSMGIEMFLAHLERKKREHDETGIGV